MPPQVRTKIPFPALYATITSDTSDTRVNNTCTIVFLCLVLLRVINDVRTHIR